MCQHPAIHRFAGVRPRRLAGTLGALASLSIAGLGLQAAPALAEDCPNAALRTEDNSVRLPECRAYEMVTPLYKEGFQVQPETFTDDGAIAYVSTGNFAGNGGGGVINQYVATRSSAGWKTTSLNPPEATYTYVSYGGFGAAALSADLHSSLWVAKRREAPADEGAYYYLHGPDGSMTRVGRGAIPGVLEGEINGLPYTQGASADLSHVFFGHSITGSGNPELAALYEYVGTGNEGLPRPVSVDNNGNEVPAEACPAGMSADGRVIAFDSGCNVGIPQLWARVGGSATVAVSASECTRTAGDPGGACNALAPAAFAGMARDGSRVYFTSTQQLVNGDTDQTNDLYVCDIPPDTPAPVGTANPCTSLTEVSGNVAGANVENVVKVSEDGSRVYFIAQGVLAANVGTNDAKAVAGDNNLYVWVRDAAHPAGQTTFIAKLDSTNLGFRPQTTAEGRYLIFSTPNRLLPSDTDEAPDVYRYDADTGSLLRLSTDTSGAGGNDPGFETELRAKAMSSDGSSVVFETAEPLSPADIDGTTDVYEWHEGQASEISNGGGTAIGISPSGRDIFFGTKQTLSADDSGTEEDIYDARVGGGFDMAPPPPCSGEACHGEPAPAPAQPGMSTSAAFIGPGSPLRTEAPPADEPKPKAQTTAQKLAKALKACRSKHNKKKRKACEKRARNTYRGAK